MVGRKKLMIATLLFSIVVIVMVVVLDIMILFSLPVSAIIRPLRTGHLSDVSTVMLFNQSNYNQKTGDVETITNHSAIVTLTNEDGPAISTLEHQLRHCSLALGMKRETLDTRAAAINTIAINLSLYLTAIRSIVPRQFSPNHTSPCWKSPLPSLRQFQQRAIDSLSTANRTRELTYHLHRQILVPAVHRSTTLRLKCLPSFFLAGFPKSGTTTLHHALSRHRLIVRPVMKEPHWWTRMPLHNEDINYLQLAVIKYLNYYSEDVQTIVRRNHQVLLYDGSQSTLWDTNFAEDNQDHCAMAVALSHILPGAKFLVMMREPVSRTYSHYLFSCTWRKARPAGPKQFHREAVRAVGLLTECLNHSSLFECVADPEFSVADSTGCGSLGYRLVVSLYSLHLEKWLQFFPRDQFLFLRLEDLSRDPYHFMTWITRFFKIPDLKPMTTRWLRKYRENQNMQKEAMLPETRTLLTHFFRPFNERLVELTGDMRFLWVDLPSN